MKKVGQSEVSYLTALLKAMILEDGNHVYRTQGPQFKVVRTLATVCPSRTSAHSVDAKMENKLLCADGTARGRP